MRTGTGMAALAVAALMGCTKRWPTRCYMASAGGVTFRCTVNSDDAITAFARA